MGAKLVDQYRPATWADVVGQDEAIRQVAILRKRGLAGRALWISGQSGTGKTTIARLIADEVADPFMIRELDAGALSVSDLQEIEREMSVLGWGSRTGRAYLVNEAHALRKPVIRQLLVLLDRLPAHVCVIFTTTCDGQATFEDYDDGGPLLSRCTRIKLSQRDLARPFAERAKAIAEKEGLDGQSLERYVRLVQSCRNNMRAVLQAIEAGEMLS